MMWITHSPEKGFYRGTPLHPLAARGAIKVVGFVLICPTILREWASYLGSFMLKSGFVRKMFV